MSFFNSGHSSNQSDSDSSQTNLNVLTAVDVAITEKDMQRLLQLNQEYDPFVESVEAHLSQLKQIRKERQPHFFIDSPMQRRCLRVSDSGRRLTKTKNGRHRNMCRTTEWIRSGKVYCKYCIHYNKDSFGLFFGITAACEKQWNAYCDDKFLCVDKIVTIGNTDIETYTNHQSSIIDEYKSDTPPPLIQSKYKKKKPIIEMLLDLDLCKLSGWIDGKLMLETRFKISDLLRNENESIVESFEGGVSSKIVSLGGDDDPNPIAFRTTVAIVVVAGITEGCDIQLLDTKYFSDI